MTTIHTIFQQWIIFCWVATVQVNASTSEHNDVENSAVQNTTLVQKKPRFYPISRRNRKQDSLTVTPYDFKTGEKRNRYPERVRKAAQSERLNKTEMSEQCKIPLMLSCMGCCETGSDSNNCYTRAKICNCDSQCTFYNDCCVDYVEYCGKTQQISYDIDAQGVSCIEPNHVTLNDVLRIWMVNKCPKSRKIDEISRNCEIDENQQLKVSNLRNFVPVFSENNLVFRNEFCAKCNSVENFEHFNEQVKCNVVPLPSMSLTKLDEFVSKYCEIFIYKEGGQTITRPCYRTELCLPIRSGRCNQTFAYECGAKEYLCPEGILREKRFGRCLSWALSVFRENVKLIASTLGLPFHIVFDVSDGKFISYVKRASCRSAKKLYDPYLEICRQTQVIPPVKENHDSYDVAVWFDCRKIRLPSMNQTIFSLTQHFNLERSQVSDLEHVRLEDTTKSRSAAIRFKLQLTNEQTLRLAKTNSTDDLMFRFESDLTNCTNCLPLRRLLFFSEKFNLSINSKIITVFKTTSRQLACIRKQTYSHGSYTSIKNGKYFYINSTGKTFSKKQVFFEDGTLNTSISVCQQIVFSTCVGHRVKLTSEEYIKFDNLSIFYKRTKTIKDFGEYEIENGQIFVCFPSLSRFNVSDSFVIQAYLNWACLALSVTCLFLVIQTYALFPDLRHLPGKNILNLSTSLFLGQLLWLIPGKWYPSRGLCHIVAVIRHYLFLVSFVSMAVITWHTYLVFARNEVPRQRPALKERERKVFYKYSTIVWGVPAVFVIVCAVVDLKDVYAVYANELLCWFDNAQAQKYLFVLPVGVILLFNIIFFALIIFHIQRVRSNTRLIRTHQRHRAMFWIYLKLSALMGFGWLFGFIHLLVGRSTPVFSYLFVIFASLQGFYIALAFVVKREIWQKYKGLFRKESTRLSHESNNDLLEKLKNSKETTL